ncbi:glycosyltransferase [Flavobacterium filum]|uniref:glycosyltransferase n=1 Tax=Flavobacterium filum TaxID=370974 RepID=UPI0023F06DF9|nr:glycosyltransferase [Flavobacterium filum]
MISAVLILRDCEKTIEACLNSIKDKVGEIICVIDTRSSEKTYWICHYFNHKNIRTYYYEWKEQDYSKPRNFGISKASGDWILSIDADETLGSIGEVNNDYHFYEANIINNLDGQDRVHKSVRLFQKNKDVYYEGATHETIEYCLNRINAKAGSMDLRIRHTGYDNLTPEQWKAKIEGLKKIYDKQLITEPDNQRNYYNLCTYSWGIKDYQSCIDYGMLSLFKKLIPTVKAQVCLLIYFSYKKLNKDEIAINYLLMSDEIYPSQSSKVKLLEYYKSIGNKESILETLNELKQITITGSRFPNDISIKTETVEQKIKEIQS